MFRLQIWNDAVMKPKILKIELDFHLVPENYILFEFEKICSKHFQVNTYATVLPAINHQMKHRYFPLEFQLQIRIPTLIGYWLTLKQVKVEVTSTRLLKLKLPSQWCICIPSLINLHSSIQKLCTKQPGLLTERQADGRTWWFLYFS